MRIWKACYEEKRFEKQILADQALTNRLGARGTPSFFINGRSLVGAQPFERFTDRIDSELEKAQKSGIPKSRYYREAVVEKGLTSAE
jgi:predicted DsbA family dithiol-disulfide isomerase